MAGEESPQRVAHGALRELFPTRRFAFEQPRQMVEERMQDVVASGIAHHWPIAAHPCFVVLDVEMNETVLRPGLLIPQERVAHAGTTEADGARRHRIAGAVAG